MDIFVARQPIFDRNKEVIGYELLYRDSSKNFFNSNISSSKATSILLINSYFSIGIKNLIGEEKAFINFDKQLIYNGIPTIFSNNTIVIELLEDIVPDEKLIKQLKKLKSAGYIIALDDFVYGYPHKDLIGLADIIKVDFLQNSPYHIEKIIKDFKTTNKKFLAEKVETLEMFNFARSVGYDYFQGYFFSKPKIVKGKRLTSNTLSYFRILNELKSEEPSYNTITNIIEYDIFMTYNLLKIINSKFSLVKEVSSIKHALTILGLEEIERWIYLLMLQDIGNEENSELLKISFFRAKLGELIADNSIYKNRKQEIMLMGLLSVIDTMLERPMEDILKLLPLSEDLKNAMLGKDSIFNTVYDLIVEYEQGSWEKVSICSQKVDVDINMLPSLYFESIKWADDISNYMENNKDNNI